MDRRRQITRLDLQLEAISEALAMARQEPSPERQAELLKVVERAFHAYHQEHQTLLARPRLRLLPGGAIGAALLSVGAGVREMWGAHRTAVVGAVAAASVITAGTLVLVPRHSDEGPPLSVPTVTVPTPSLIPTPTPSERGRAPSPSASVSEVPLPTSSPSPSPSPSALVSMSPAGVASSPGVSPSPVGTVPAERPTPSAPGPGRGTDPVEPPGLAADEDGGEGDERDRPEPEPERCTLGVDVPGAGTRLGRLLCL